MERVGGGVGWNVGCFCWGGVYRCWIMVVRAVVSVVVRSGRRVRKV